jgi:predicted O-methyltransferase YrrM
MISAMSGWISRTVFAVADLLLLPVILAAAIPFRLFRKLGGRRLPMSRELFRSIGIWPLRKNYYDPLFDPRDLSAPLEAERRLPGIDWNVEEQLVRLRNMNYVDELKEFLTPKTSGPRAFSFDNDSFLSGDADYLYSFVRSRKPRRIVEIGCGNSTLLMAAAIEKNRTEDGTYSCSHICVEPYENAWLDELNVTVIRERVERLDLQIFVDLQKDDLLFIDSSHIIRPCGDVVFELLEVLPRLDSGVYVHVHDIFSPRNYLPEWLNVMGYLWNEQYLLEAFLSQNTKYRIVGALNYLHHNHYADLESICARYDRSREPGSFYIQRV